MVHVASGLTFALKIPFVMCELDVSNICWIEGNVAVPANLVDGRATTNRDISDHAAIAKRDIDDLVCHAGLRLARKELCPALRQSNGCYHLTRLKISDRAHY